MARRVPPSEREVYGARLVRSTEGGYSVLIGRAYLGYIHASVGDQWNVYRRMINQLDDHLGRVSGQDEAVRRILIACGRVVGRAPGEAAA